jgi:hypothetical protein
MPLTALLKRDLIFMYNIFILYPQVQVQVQKEVELPLGLGSTWLELPCPGNSCAVQDACASNILPREGSRCPAPRQLDITDGAKDNSTLTWRECNCPIPKVRVMTMKIHVNLF